MRQEPLGTPVRHPLGPLGGRKPPGAPDSGFRAPAGGHRQNDSFQRVSGPERPPAAPEPTRGPGSWVPGPSRGTPSEGQFSEGFGLRTASGASRAHEGPSGPRILGSGPRPGDTVGMHVSGGFWAPNGLRRLRSPQGPPPESAKLSSGRSGEAREPPLGLPRARSGPK